MLIGQTVRRVINRQVRNQADSISNSVVAEVQRMLEGKRSEVIPAGSQYLNTRDMAVRLGSSEITVARLCRRGLIDADKTAGNKWRTTEARLRRSPYLNAKKRKGTGNGKLE